jgi:hypothetical protein
MIGDLYCELPDVLGRLYSGQGMSGAAPVDDDRDALLNDLIYTRSRDFDQEVWQSAEHATGLFTPQVEQRLYSGDGRPTLYLSPFLALIRVEIDATPGQAVHTWQDFTPEIAQNRMAILPLRGWPKSRLFRQATFYQDPWGTGNIRMTMLWGICLPDPGAAVPDETWETANLDPYDIGPDITVASIQPPGGGWWVTPPDVTDAVASWVVHTYQAAKSGYGENTGSGQSAVKVKKTIPDNVQHVIDRYKGETKAPKFALVPDDGSDIADPVGRWAGWQTIT